MATCNLCQESPAVTFRRAWTVQDPVVPVCRDCARVVDEVQAEPDYANESAETKVDRLSD